MDGRRSENGQFPRNFNAFLWSERDTEVHGSSSSYTHTPSVWHVSSLKKDQAKRSSDNELGIKIRTEKAIDINVFDDVHNYTTKYIKILIL